jgi:Domain of unknown function (DUF4124)
MLGAVAAIAHDPVAPWPVSDACGTEQTGRARACTLVTPLTHPTPMRHPSQRFKPTFFAIVVALFTLLALGFALSAHPAVVYRWVDKQGKTHFGDAVPSEYKDVAKPLDNKVTAPSPEEQRRAVDRVAEQKETRKAQALKTSASAAASAPSAAAAASPSLPKHALKRPAQAPTEDSDCETWRRLYRESLDCFGPYRTARGATKAEAFEHCTPVSEPPQRCGRDAP